ncbi:MAG: flippase-like domain-containing protein [Desulfobulbaceae bacterium]|nr:flippase-like domain-containing protein [Desulfobulbaceae bacterium]
MKEKYRGKILFVKAAVSAAFFFLLLSFVQHNALISVFTDVNWTFFTLSFVLAFVMLMVSCMKWKVLLDASGRRINYFLLLRIYFIGYFFSNLLPSTFGGDVVRSYYVGRMIENQASAAASIFLERFTGILCLLLLVVIAPLLHPELYRNPFIYIPSAGAAFLLFLVFCIWKMKEPFSLPDKAMKHIFTTLNRWTLRMDMRRMQRLVAGVENVYVEFLKRLRRFKIELQTSLAALRSNRRNPALVLMLTAAFYFLTWVNVHVSFLAFGVQPGFAAICALVPTIMFVGQIPLTILGNLGFIESIFVIYFLQMQIPAAESLAMVLLLRIKILSLGTIGYFVYLSLTRGDNKTFRPFNGGSA